VALRDVTMEYETETGGGIPRVLALRGVNLVLHEGEFLSIVGPSGCGKSTLLKLISGLIRPSRGSVTVDGREVTQIPAGIGFMFQNDALLPWATVQENIAVALELRGVSRTARPRRVAELVELVGLSGFGAHYPGSLSGGMRKRVSLARILAYDPEVYLMDEPFGSLDTQTKIIMGREFLRIWSDLRKSVAFVTHDLEEAIALSDRVVVMTSRPGTVKSEHVIPLARPRDFYEVRLTDEFREIHREIWHELAVEVDKAYERRTPPPERRAGAPAAPDRERARPRKE
jgi:NitT/TauT family transport system ATP-binding protein